MKTKRHSKLSIQNKKKQKKIKKIKKIKKTKKTKKRGGVYIIGNEDSPDIPNDPNVFQNPYTTIIDDVNEDMVQDDPTLSPEIQDIADNSIINIL